MSAKDLNEIYKEYADWQSNYAHGKSGKTVKRMLDAIDRAKRNIIDDVESIVEHFYKQGDFSDRGKAESYLSQPMDLKTKQMLKESIMKIEDPKEREKAVWRFTNRSLTNERLTNKGVLLRIVENTITDVYNTVNGVMQKSLVSTIKESATRSMFNIQRGCRAGWSFQQPNKRQIGALMKSVYNSGVAENFAKQHADTVKAILVGGVASGTPVNRIAHQINAETSAEMWKAKRLVRTEITKAGNIGEAYALESAGIEKYEFSCTLDERTCPVCGSMDGKVFELDKSQMGVNFPPMHPNCRCWTHAALTKSIQDKMTRSHRDPETGKTDYVPMSMKYDEWKAKYIDKEETPTQERVVVNDLTVEELQKANESITVTAIKNNVEYRQVGQLERPLSEQEMIAKVSGGDKTGGACSSLALAYIGNIHGYDVRDFRGGKSTNLFASTPTIRAITEDVGGYVGRGSSSLKVAMDTLEKVEEGKIYYMAVGRHAAVVRKKEGEYQFLELQSPNSEENGFQPLGPKRFLNRFGCHKSPTHVLGMEVEEESFLIDIDLLNSEEIDSSVENIQVTPKGLFRNWLGFLNTAENKQIKGRDGNIK